MYYTNTTMKSFNMLILSIYITMSNLLLNDIDIDCAIYFSIGIFHDTVTKDIP